MDNSSFRFVVLVWAEDLGLEVTLGSFIFSVCGAFGLWGHAWIIDRFGLLFLFGFCGHARIIDPFGLLSRFEKNMFFSRSRLDH